MNKRLIGAILSLCMLFTVMAQPVWAGDDEEDITIDMVTDELSREEIDTYKSELKDIPVYVANYSSKDLIISDKAKEIVSDRIEDDDAVADIQVDKSTKVQVEELKNIEKGEYISNTIYKDTFDRVHELIEDGANVGYVILYKPQKQPSGLLMASANNEGSASYWESNFPTLGSYNGYKFLYSESCVSFSTNKVVPGNLNTSLSWTSLIKKGITTAATMVLGGTSKTVNIATGITSTILGSVETPLNITYSKAGEGHYKAWVDGEIYLRTVYIKDKLNKIPNYAYYSYAHTEQTKLNQGVDVKYPISQRPAGTYNYAKYAKYGSAKITSTDGFSGNVSFYKKVIDKYISSGYSQYIETINVGKNVKGTLS